MDDVTTFEYKRTQTQLVENKILDLLNGGSEQASVSTIEAAITDALTHNIDDRRRTAKLLKPTAEYLIKAAFNDALAQDKSLTLLQAILSDDKMMAAEVYDDMIILIQSHPSFG